MRTEFDPPRGFAIRPEYADKIVWNTRGSCGEPGCQDPICCCSLCARPVGVSEDDPRWQDHDEECGGCDLCYDQVPLILFRDVDGVKDQAQFHIRCFEQAACLTEGPV